MSSVLPKLSATMASRRFKVCSRSACPQRRPEFEARVKALERELGARTDRSERGFLHDLVVRDIASLQNLLVEVSEADLKKAVTLLEKAEVIYLLGQLRSAPVVDLLRYILTMLGKRCVLLDPSGGLATHMARAIRKTDLLFAVSFRFYATEVVNIVDEAAKRKVPVIAISDSTLSPVAKAANVLLGACPRNSGFQWRRWRELDSACL